MRFVAFRLGLLCVVLFCSACSSKQASGPSEVPDNVQDQILEEQLHFAVLKQQAAEPMSEGAIQPVPTFQAAKPKPGVIRPGMKIAFEVVEDEALKGTYQVQFNGDLMLPYSVKVAANGLTISELKRQMAKSYAPYFRYKPTMRVSIADNRQLVEVQGLVAKPGKVFLRKTDSLDHVIAECGGLGTPGDIAEEKAPKYVRVIPTTGPSYAVGLRDYYAGVSPVSFQWTGGDRIFFQSERPSDLLSGGTVERDSVQLLGQIQTPGAYPYESGKSFFHYLVVAGGPTEKTDFEKIEVVRLHEGKRQTKRYNLSKKEVLPDISAGDIVIVHAVETDDTVTNASSILSSIAAAIIAAFTI